MIATLLIIITIAQAIAIIYNYKTRNNAKDRIN
jgi:hypothetical protein